MNTIDFGKNLAELRRRKGLTQEDLADVCRMHVRSIQRLEAGQVRPRAYTIGVLSTALGYDLSRSIGKPRLSIQQWMTALKHKIKMMINGGETMYEESVLQRLSKSTNDKKIAGICGGLGEHTAVPAWMWRIIFILSSFFYFIGGLTYILLWIFMPKAGDAEADTSDSPNWLNRLGRSLQDRKIAGICGGLGKDSPIPSWCWRIIFILLMFVYGIGIGLYLLLWIFMPKTSQQDEPVACLS